MKVTETDTDRTAFAHIYVDGRVKALEEYGQYIDASDRAVCCYVAVEEGQKVRVEGRFSGVTLNVAYDFLVDGVCRKAHIYTSKSVQLHKSKKLDFEKFLYQTPDGVIDTDMLVSPRSESVVLGKDAPETIGTMELRVYITRQLGIEHDINGTRKYDKIVDDANIGAQVASYKDVAPQFHMTFEKNCSTLDSAKGNRERRKVYAKRPGKEPWAIFRFHYRSKESILGSDMKLTFSADDRILSKAEPHALEFEPVPALLSGSKPAGKNDGDVSVRTSSPAPPDTPATPSKGSKKTKDVQPKVVVRKQHTNPASTTTASAPPMTPVTDMGTATIAKLPAPNASDMLDIVDGQSARPRVKGGSSTTAKVIETDKPSDSAVAAAKDGDRDLFPLCSKKSIKKVTKKAATDTTDVPAEFMEAVRKDEKPRDEIQLELADWAPKMTTTKTDDVPAISTSADLPRILQPPATLSTIFPQSTVTASTKDFTKNGAQPFVPPFRKTVAKPASIDTATTTLLKKPAVICSPVTPVKRAPEGTLTPPPDVKRIKTDAVPPLTPTMPARLPSVSPSLRAMSIESQLSEHRKRLEATRKKRAEMAAKKAAIDERMAPYKQRMAEELERLQQEMAAEQNMLDEDEQEVHASEAMLAEFECADDGV
ncbi:hypothetical protein N0V95_005392 [Ascochyta clinopodiicola]|nr:hypothetical protein N0V95_005392 [Ascochyta clinopodiicola]